MLVPTGGRKPTETSVTMFATKARIFSKQKREFISPGAKKIKIILYNTRTVHMPAFPLYRGLFLWCLDRAGFGRSEPGERE